MTDSTTSTSRGVTVISPQQHSSMSDVRSDEHVKKKGSCTSPRCMFAVTSVVVTAIAVALFITLVFTTMNTFIDTAVKSKAQAVILGAESSIHRAQLRVRRRSRSLRHIIVNTPVRSGTTNTYDVLKDLNATLWREIGGRQMSSNNTGYLIAITGPPTTLEAYRQQDPQQQHTCPIFCRREENDAFTNLSMFAMFRDEVEGQPVENRHFYSARNFSSDVVVYNLSIETSRHVRPSWSQDFTTTNDGRKDNRLQHHWRIGKALRTIKPLSSYGNGSLFEGGWIRLAITSSPNGNSYYITTFRQVFLHPATNLTIIIAALMNAKTFQSILTSHASASLGPDNRLMVVDEIPRVVSYNQDPFGDSRLRECVITTAPGTVGRNCEDLYAVDHPHPFVRWLFATHMRFIMDGHYERETGEKWIQYLDARHLVVVKEILRQGTVRLIAVSVLSEKSVIGTIKESAIVLVAFFSIVVAVGCALLSCAGMLTLSSAQSTVELIAKLADCIAYYNVDAATDVIADVQKKRRFCKGPTSMEIQFSQIIENLRLYRPYLPASLTLDESATDEDINQNWFDTTNSTPSGSIQISEKGQGGHCENSMPSMSVQVIVDATRSPSGLTQCGGSSMRTHQGAAHTRGSDEAGGCSANTPVFPIVHRSRNSVFTNHLEISVRAGRQVSKENPSAFQPFSGSLILVDFGNLPAGANVQRGNFANAAGITHIVHLFLDTCIRKAKVYRGVVEVLRANQVLISFNCHRSISDHANVAALCAIGLRTSLNELVVSHKVLTTSLQLFRMNTTISVTTGTGIIGTAGTTSTKSKVLAGEPLDLIYTFPPLQRILGVGILVCNSTSDGLLPSTFVTIPSQVIHPFRTGYHSQHVSTVYELVGTTLSTPAPKMKEVKLRTEIFRLMYTGGKTSRIISLLNSHSQNSPSFITPFWKTYINVLVDEWEKKSIKTVTLRPRVTWGWDPLEGRLWHDTVRLRAFNLLYVTNDNLLTSCSDAIMNPQDERLIANKQLQLFKADALAARVSSIQQPSFVEVASRSYNAGGDECGGDEDEFLGPLFSMFVQPSNSRRGPTIPAAPNTSISKSSDLPSGESDIRNSSFFFMSSSGPPPSGDCGASSGANNSNPDGPSCSSLIVSVNKDRYFVTDKLIGKGAFGFVVLALHETGGLVAMKQIPLTVLDEGVDPLIQEMELLSSLNHPNIASYVTCAVNKRDNTFCIMTEYLAAGSLYDLIKISAPYIPVQIAIKYARDIANGLHYLHTRNPPILHLDVKPQNVLMSTDGCKLIDFGTSKFFFEADKSISVRGTPRYMAPEAAMGEFSPASDVFSLGITLLHMLVGRPPWDHVPGDDNVFMMRLARDPTLRPEIPEWIDRPVRSLLQLCTSRNPASRPTAKELLSRMDSLFLDAKNQDMNGCDTNVGMEDVIDVSYTLGECI